MVEVERMKLNLNADDEIIEGSLEKWLDKIPVTEVL